MKSSGLLLGGFGALAIAVPAHAEIVESASGGFASHNEAMVAGPAGEVWDVLIHPEDWWSHTWSNDSANLSLDVSAGGCFCETIPSPTGGVAGSAEHMRVVMVLPGSTLRMVGALGPLQAEGLSGTLTVTLEQVEERTRISWDYVVGGQWRMAPQALAPVVDAVQREFLGGLVDALGGPIESSLSTGE